MERFSFVFFVAGIGFFVLAFIVSAILPWVQFTDLEILSVEQLAKDPPLEFIELKEQYPEAFDKAFGDVPIEVAFEDALRTGRKVYIGEACWHCHSQQVRPVGSDEARFGRVSYPEEYNNEMNYPPLWGTRRIGPDLIREAGRQSNDWHVAHFWHPPDVSPTSVMPSYTWFFYKDDPGTPEDESLMPNKKGMSIIAYVQWLGSWERSRDENLHSVDGIERKFEKPQIIRPTDEVPEKVPPTPERGLKDNTPSQPDGKPAEDDPFGDGGADPFGDGANGGGAKADDPFADDAADDPFN